MWLLALAGISEMSGIERCSSAFGLTVRNG